MVWLSVVNGGCDISSLEVLLAAILEGEGPGRKRNTIDYLVVSSTDVNASVIDNLEKYDLRF